MKEILQNGVLVLAGTELIFFPVAAVGLCFGCFDDTGMFLLLLSRAHTDPRPLLLLALPHQ